jgi:hypothetical protein
MPSGGKSSPGLWPGELKKTKINTINTQIHDCSGAKESGAYLRKIAPMASSDIAFYFYHLLIICPGIHVYVYYMIFAK